MELLGFALATGLQVVGTLAVAASAWAIWAAQTNPKLLLALNDEVRREGERHGIRHYSKKDGICLCLIVLGFGIASYGAAYFGLSWIPDSWGRIDDDGEWAPARVSLSFIAAFCGAFALIQFLMEHSRLRMREQQRTEERTAGQA